MVGITRSKIIDFEAFLGPSKGEPQEDIQK